MRVIKNSVAALLVALILVIGASPAKAQDLLPEQSVAKAKQLLQQVIAALGGDAYLNVHDMDCDGRVAQIGTNDEMMEYTLFRDMWIFPDKNRTEYIIKGENTMLAFMLGMDSPYVSRGGVLITLFDGKDGWTLDKGGVSAQPAEAVRNFDEQVKTGMNNMLRERRNDPGVEIRYAGVDIIDLKEAEWIEFTDASHREMRLAVDHFTHLPVRWVVSKRDPDTKERTELSTSYTQYQTMDGVKTALSMVRERNGNKILQMFLQSCKYNSSLEAQLFTRAALEQRSAEIAKKANKNAKDKQ